MPTLRCSFTHVLAFSDRRPHSGNAAGVLTLDADAPPPPDTALLSAAALLRLSETCFATPIDAGNGLYALRWFTPTREVDLCGHGTLAAAHALWAAGSTALTLPWRTRSGELRVRRQRRGGSGGGGCSGAPTTRGTLDFPCHTPRAVPLGAPDGALARLVAAALGAAPLLEPPLYDPATRKLLLVTRAEHMRGLAPDVAALVRIDQGGLAPEARVTGIAVTALGHASDLDGDDRGSEDDTFLTARADFVSRYWSPWNGLPGPSNEDPVNGSSHTLLAPYYAARLGRGDGAVMTAAVLSPSGGRMQCAVVGDRVALTGDAVTLCEGHMWLSW